MFEEQLKEFGLSDTEVKIYLILLERGTLSPSIISEKLGLHRGYTYDLLERMREKQVISTIKQNNKRQYQAVKPQSLIELIKLRVENLQAIVPKLNKLELSQKKDVLVEVHEGKRALLTLLRDIVEHTKGKELLAMGVDEELLYEIEPIYLKQYSNNIQKKRIKERNIIKTGGKKVSNPNLQYKELPPEYLGNTMQVIYSDRVATFINGNPRTLIIIQNKEVAETQRKQFELLWKIAKP